MSNANVIFNLDGINLTIQCSTEDKMRDICQKYASKVQIPINLLIFLYGGNLINMEIIFKDQASSLDKDNNVIKVLVYRTINNGFVCPNCGGNIKLDLEKIDDIILSNNNIKDTIEGIKLNMETIIKISSNIINIQLKNINILLGNIIEDIKKNNEKLKNLLSDSNTIINKALINNNDFHNKNLISGVLDIKINEINNKVILFETAIKEGIDVYLNNQKINMIKEGNKSKIDYIFENDGKYNFQIVINANMTNMEGFFEKCSNIIFLDFSNFNTSNVTNMSFMFNGCNKLKEIKGINKFITNKVLKMNCMFQQCYELEYLDLTSFNTINVNNMECMFNKCFKLKEIKGINKFNTSEVKNMNLISHDCKELESLGLSNFNTSKVTIMSYMFR